MLNPDYLLERSKIKKQASYWRSMFFIFLIVGTVLLAFAQLRTSKVSGFNLTKPQIARVAIEGVIFEDKDRAKILTEIKENKDVKAVILHINSPGGTAVGGEVLYNNIKAIAKEKPVVAVMSSMATSAAYLTSLGADQVFARNGTITGSIGVISEIPNLKEAGDKLGIKFNYVKTSPLKGSPNLFEEKNEAALKIIEETMEDFYNYFVDIVAEERDITRLRALELADGRIYSAKRAVEYKLIDSIGGENDAFDWLVKNKKLSKDLKIEDVSLEKPKTPLEELMGTVTKTFDIEAISNKYQFKGLSL